MEKCTTDGNILECAMDGHLMVITMVHRPHNLLGPRLMDALLGALEQAKSCGARAVLLRSGLRHFSAGAELEMFEAVLRQERRDMPIDPTGFLKAFEAAPFPIVAAVHGVCVGGGLELALACDYIIATSSAKLGAVEASLGLHPLMGAVQRIAQRAGATRAKEMALLARRYDAATLEHWGLINCVVADDALDATSLLVAQELANGPTVAHAATKQLARLAVDQGVSAADEALSEIRKANFRSEDLKIGVAAYRTSGPGTARFQGH